MAEIWLEAIEDFENEELEKAKNSIGFFWLIDVLGVTVPNVLDKNNLTESTLLQNLVQKFQEKIPYDKEKYQKLEVLFYLYLTFSAHMLKMMIIQMKSIKIFIVEI